MQEDKIMARKTTRKFRTHGGGIVTWTYDETASAGVADHGPWECSGCLRSVKCNQGTPGNANDHARVCHEIP